jgi:hypothetical protein
MCVVSNEPFSGRSDPCARLQYILYGYFCREVEPLAKVLAPLQEER